MEDLRKADDRNTIKLNTKVDGKRNEWFHRFYMCLGALRESLLSACRKVMGLDGCHLSGPQLGIFLSVVGVDPNNSLYPIAIFVVEIENRAT